MKKLINKIANIRNSNNPLVQVGRIAGVFVAAIIIAVVY